MTGNIFETPATPEVKFEDLVGDGKKYADNNAAAKAITEKDAFIARLLEEARRRDEDIKAAANTKAFEDRMTALEQAQLAERREPLPREATPATVTPQLDEEAVFALMEKREQANARTRNLIAVKDKLTEVYGAEFPNRVKARAAELNISIGQLNAMAAETPQAFFALIGLTSQKPVDNTAPPATRHNSASFAPEVGKKNNAYYQNLRKTNPSLYWTPAVQMEEYQELKRQGEQFGL